METAIELLRKKIREFMNDYADNISTGAATDYPSYKHQCGVIEGLAIAERELLDILERLDDELNV
jgi:hypothetical protein